MSANLKVVDFPNYNLRDIPNILRNIANKIEANEYGHAKGCVVVLHADQLEVFGMGEADGTVTHYLLACAQRKIEGPML
jgi:cytoskeletal protein CcmA (bactofilin family)